MTCPQCRLHPIHLRAKHGLCIKCGYQAGRQKVKEKRAKEKKKKLGNKKRICPQCKVEFKIKYIDHIYCTPECQKCFKISSRNIEWGKKKPRGNSSLSIPSLLFKKARKFNNFDKNVDSIVDD